MKPLIESAIVEELVQTGTFSSFKVIDTHGHMGGHSGIWMPNAEPADMIRTMDRCGVQRLVFSAHDALQDQVSGNEVSQAAILAHPDRFLGYWTANANYPDLVASGVAGAASRTGFVGYKILAGYYGTPITLPAYRPLWAHAHEEKLVVLLHTWGGDMNADCGKVSEIAEEFPGATILMAHCQYGYWDEAIACAREHENVYCELTAAYAPCGVIKKMVDDGIEDKITFGTDLPWFDPMMGIGCIVFAEIGDAARRKILRDNAARIFERWL